VGFGLFWFAEPIADDFERGSVSDWASYVLGNYQGWTGRWAGISLASIVLPRIDLINGYTYLLLAIQVLHLVGLLAFSHTLLDRFATIREKLWCALVSWAFLFAAYPAPEETVYWASGAFEYAIPFDLGLLLFAGIHMQYKGSSGGAFNVTGTVLLAIFAFFITGLHELAGLMLVGALLTGLIFAIAQGDPRRRIWVLPLVTSTIGTVITIIAPGNTIRAQTDFSAALSASVTSILEVIARQIYMVISNWMLDVKLLGATALLVIWLTGGKDTSNPSQFRSRSGYWIIPSMSTIILLGGITTIVLVTGTSGNRRTQNLLFLVFTAGWFTSLVFFVRSRVSTESPLIGLYKTPGRVAILLIFGMALLTSPNVMRGGKFLVMDARRWHHAIHDRYALVMREKAAFGSNPVPVFVPPVDAPRVFYREFDIGADPNYWSNKGFARYFGISSIQVVSPPRR
jgi:hypothetical protein